jgi:hypothetical protein
MIVPRFLIDDVALQAKTSDVPNHGRTEHFSLGIVINFQPSGYECTIQSWN